MVIAAVVLAVLGGIALTKLPGRQNVTAYEDSHA